jgi:hypothetical protein
MVLCVVFSVTGSVLDTVLIHTLWNTINYWILLTWFLYGPTAAVILTFITVLLLMNERPSDLSYFVFSKKELLEGALIGVSMMLVMTLK